MRRNLQPRRNAARDEIEIRLDEIEAGQTEFTGEQKSQAGVIVTIGHNGKPVYHCGLVERRGKGVSTNDTDSDSPKEEKDGVSAALLQDLTIQRTAALRAALSVRPDIALIAITHNLAAQIFYDRTYLLPSSLTVRTEHTRMDSILERPLNQKPLRQSADKPRKCVISYHPN